MSNGAPAAVLDHVRRSPDLPLPAYITDHAGLATWAAAVRAALPSQVELLYAAKANPDPDVLRCLAPHVDGFEVASGGELSHAAAAVPTAPLSFGGPGKSEAELALAADRGVHRLHVESERELHLLTGLAAAAGRPIDVLLRVNAPLHVPGAALAMGGGPTPFGLDPSRLDAAARLVAASPWLRLRGLHLHLASGLDAAGCALVAQQAVRWALDWARRTDNRLEELNLGGGMAVDYADPAARFDWPAYGQTLTDLVRRHPGLRLKVEPGRSLTAYAGCYVTTVLDVKRSYGRAFAVLAGGTHHLRTPAARGHDQPCTVVPIETWPADLPRPAVAGEPVTLVGQLCTPRDVLARDVPLPALRAGDLVVFTMAGAYSWNISHTAFLMHPAPAFVHLQRTPRPSGAGLR
ncbi:MAG: alanine racemase [Actinobacteria bacterium]|nr:alanine racemase [Actinomycetota bacterium]MBW3646156.1 alanine racemase [Actinomycetota bacterium]